MDPFAGGGVRKQRVGGLRGALPGGCVSGRHAVLPPVREVPRASWIPPRRWPCWSATTASMQVMYLITYVIFGIVLAVLALALHARLKDGAPTLAQAATAVGLDLGRRAGRERDDLQRRHGGGRRAPGHRSGPGSDGLAGDRAGGQRPRRVRRRASRRPVGPAGERGGAAHRATAQGAELAGRGDRRRGRPLGRCRRSTTWHTASGCCRSSPGSRGWASSPRCARLHDRPRLGDQPGDPASP